MYLFKILSLAFAATALASPLSRRDGQTIVDDLSVVDQKVRALNSSITAFQGGSNGLTQALQVQQKSSDVLKQLNATTADALASAALTEDEAYAIGNAVADLTPVVTSTLDNLQSKKDAFDSSSVPLGDIVKGQLNSQRQATVDLSAAVVAKVPSELQTAAGQFVQPILDKFDETIAVYS